MKQVDTLVIGSGIAGLSAALAASKLGSVALVTKAALRESNTRYAQGGIAAVTSKDDDVELHIEDTRSAGAGLCDEAAVRILCSEGPARIDDLLALGVAFDRRNGELARGLEAAHQRHRVLHAGGDATGSHVEEALVDAVRRADIDLFEHTTLTDFLKFCGDVRGAHFLSADGTEFTIRSAATILASGGAGQLYSHTTNPSVATGDGLAAAFRAGAVVADLEFMQFHPTAAAIGSSSFLISEAVRGEGAVLRNASGERFMTEVDERAELAPRDVVARSIAFEMAKQDGKPVVLDATALGAAFLAERFPTIDAMCTAAGVDWSKEAIPITPAAHYWMGGVRTDIEGRTSLPGLFAVGEVANTGVHGANRLASNSLLEGLVFATRAIRAIASGERSAARIDGATSVSADNLWVPEREDTQRAMWQNAGLLRDDSGLVLLQKMLTVLTVPADAVAVNGQPLIEDVEDENLALVARLLSVAALNRRESRGAHYRSDFQNLDLHWQHHQMLVRA